MNDYTFEELKNEIENNKIFEYEVGTIKENYTNIYFQIRGIIGASMRIGQPVGKRATNSTSPPYQL